MQKHSLQTQPETWVRKGNAQDQGGTLSSPPQLPLNAQVKGGRKTKGFLSPSLYPRHLMGCVAMAPITQLLAGWYRKEGGGRKGSRHGPTGIGEDMAGSGEL